MRYTSFLCQDDQSGQKRFRNKIIWKAETMRSKTDEIARELVYMKLPGVPSM